MPILRSYYQDVYRSPVVRLDGYSGRHGLTSSILAYLDFGGATGTSKDGLAETMLAFATERGALQPGMPVVEVSSGSFGAALAVSCATTGHPCILVVPSNLPIARRQRLQELGAKIVVCSSGGTVTGVAEYIKAWNSMIRIVAVEPAECAAISGGFIGQHGIAGIGPGFVPENYNPYVVDTVLTVTTADAERASKEVLLCDGIPACTSGGATLAAAVQLMEMGKAKRPLCIFAGRRMYE